MNRKDAEELIGSYEALVARAAAIINDRGPPWGNISHPEWARLSFDGDDVVITSVHAEIDYDSPAIEPQEVRFPAVLLFMTESELRKWKAKARADYEAEESRQMAQAAANEERQERALLEALKRKYGQ